MAAVLPLRAPADRPADSAPTGHAALAELLDGRRLWQGRTSRTSQQQGLSTGFPALDQLLPGGGWPAAALSEILHPAPGVGELRLVWPALAKLSAAGQRIVLVTPPHLPHAPAWQLAGIDPSRLRIVRAASARQALWAAEQCLRSGSCGAVLCWPALADDRSLRRLQVAAETGRTLALAWRPARAARNASPAALRLLIETRPSRLRVLKCRGAMAPARSIALPVR